MGKFEWQKTASGNLIRPLQRLYPLETVENHNLSEIKILSKATLTNEDSDLDRDVVKNNVTKYGRVVKAPIRYTYWNN